MEKIKLLPFITLVILLIVDWVSLFFLTERPLISTYFNFTLVTIILGLMLTFIYYLLKKKLILFITTIIICLIFSVFSREIILLIFEPIFIAFKLILSILIWNCLTYNKWFLEFYLNSLL